MMIKVKKITIAGAIFFGLVFGLFFYEVYMPVNAKSLDSFVYTVKKGENASEISTDLQKLGAIKSAYFFRLYVNLSLQRPMLQAGDYNLSPKMSIYQIAKKIARGESIKDKVVILEGWDLSDIAKYLESKSICKKGEFLALTKKDYSDAFEFLQDKPKPAGLEGYLFPDTYEVSEKETCQGMIERMLENFGRKMTIDLRSEIVKQKKSIFDIVTMASMIEKEVRTMDDKKIVSGILWKRIGAGMPLQLDATVNYITGKNDPGVAIKDTKIDSPYNTYKYRGLPKGPISSPGLDSLLAAIHPVATKFWFYLSDGKTYFSETLEQHSAYKAQYLD